jgi:hypothetical protein
MWSRTGYGEVVCLTQGSPPALALNVVIGVIKPNRLGEPEAVKGAKGGRFTDSTDDSEPVKPGNSVEDKTLTTGKMMTCYQARMLHMSSMKHGKLWTKSDSDAA